MRQRFILFVIVIMLVSQSAESVSKESASKEPIPKTDEISCKDTCFQSYGKDKTLYAQCVKDRCQTTLKYQASQIAPKETKKEMPMKNSFTNDKANWAINRTKIIDRAALGRVKIRNLSVQVTENRTSPKSAKIGVETTAQLVHKDDKAISDKSKKEMKVLPPYIKQKVTGIQNITLVDGKSPKYVVKSKIKGKLLGIVPISINKNYEINAETGDTIQVNAPWWSRFTTQIALPGEGQQCKIIKNKNACAEGLRCEPVSKIAKNGVCRLYPQAFHGRIVFVWGSWDDLESYFEEAWQSIPLSEARRWAYETDDGIEVSFYKWLEWWQRANDGFKLKAFFMLNHFEGDTIEINPYTVDELGNFKLPYVRPGRYLIYLALTEEGTDYRTVQFWIFSINEDSGTSEINLCGSAYNDYNKIRMLESTLSVPIVPPLPLMPPPGSEPQPPPGPCD